MSNDKRQAWRTVSDEVMSTYADSPMGTTHAVEMAAEKGYDLGAHHGRKEALESGESWAKFRADMGPGVGPAWQVSEIDPRGNGVRLVLWGTGVSVSYERGLRQLLNQSLPVDVTAYPAAPATDERDAFEAVGHRKGMDDALDIVEGRKVDDAKFKAQAADLRVRLTKIRNDAFIAGFSSARDVLATLANEAEATARGQAIEAEQAQTRAAASATRAAVQRGGVALLDREIAALKGGA